MSVIRLGPASDKLAANTFTAGEVDDLGNSRDLAIVPMRDMDGNPIGGTRSYDRDMYGFSSVPAGSTFGFYLDGVDDTVHDEVGEGYIFALMPHPDPSNAVYTVVGAVGTSLNPAPGNNVTVHIIDAQSIVTDPTVSIGTSAGVITEGAANNCVGDIRNLPRNCATITVSMDVPRDDPVNVLIVRATSGLAGTVDPADYTLMSGNTPIIVSGNRFTVRVPAGQVTASFTMTAVSGDGPEENGALIFTVQENPDYIVATHPNNAVGVTIANDPADKSTAIIDIGPARAGCSSTTYIITEAVAGGNNCAVVTVHFNPPVTSNVNIFLSISGHGGADYRYRNNPRFTDVTLGLDGGATIAASFFVPGIVNNSELIISNATVANNGHTYSFTVTANREDGDDNNEYYLFRLDHNTPDMDSSTPAYNIATGGGSSRVGSSCAGDDLDCIPIYIEDEDTTTMPELPIASIATSAATITEAAVPGTPRNTNVGHACTDNSHCARITVNLRDSGGFSQPARSGFINVKVGITYSGAADATIRDDDFVWGGVADEGNINTNRKNSQNVIIEIGVSVPALHSSGFIPKRARDDPHHEADGIITYTVLPGDGYTVTTTAADHENMPLAEASSTRVTIVSDERLQLPLLSIETNIATITENDTAGFNECGTGVPGINCAVLSVIMEGIVRADGMTGAPAGGLPVMVSITSADDNATQDADYTVLDEHNMPIAVTGGTFQVTIEELFTGENFHVQIAQDAEAERDGVLTFAIVPSTDNSYVVTQAAYNEATPLAAASSTRITLESEDLPQANIRISTDDGDPAAQAVISENGGVATITVTFTPFLFVDSTNIRFRVVSANPAAPASTEFLTTSSDIAIDLDQGTEPGEFFMEVEGTPAPMERPTSPRIVGIRDVAPVGGSTYTFTVSGRDDAAMDAGESYTFALQPLLANKTYDLGGQSAVTVHVRDEDGGTPPVPQASIATSTANILEDSTDTTCTGHATSNCAIVTVLLSGVAPDGGLSVNISPAAFGVAGARESTDYTLSGDPITEGGNPISTITPGTQFAIGIDAGTVVASFTITATPDMDVEANGGFSFTLVDGTGYTVAGTPRNITSVTITNDDMTQATVMVDGAGSATVTEGETTTVTVTFAEPHPDAEVNLFFDVAFIGTATIINHNAFSDITVSGLGSATHTVREPLGGGTLTINNVPAGDSFSFTITATVDAADPGEGYELTLGPSSAYSVAEVPAGATTCADNPNCISIHIEDVGTAPPVASIAASNTIAAENGPASDDRSCPANSNCSTVTVLLSRVVGHDVAVTVGFTATSDVAAVATDDYMLEGLASGFGATGGTFTVTVPAARTSGSFTIIAVNDDAVEGNGVLSFTIQEDPGDPDSYTRVVDSGDVASVTIDSEDVPVLSVSSSATSVDSSPLAVDEGVNATITVHFDSFTFNPPQPVNLSFFATPIGTVEIASPTADALFILAEGYDSASFTYVNSMLTFSNVTPPSDGPPGSPLIFSFTVNVVDDDVDDDGEGFRLSLFPDTNTYRVDPANNGLSIYINDNDGADPVPAVDYFNFTTIFITEGAEANCSVGSDTSCATLTVGLNTLAPAGGLPVRVGISKSQFAASIPQASDYTVTGGVDLSSSSFTVTIPAGADSFSFSITANDDDIIEADEGWDFAVLADDAEPARYTVNALPTNLRVTIGSDEPRPVASLSANTTTISEDGVDNCAITSGSNCATVTITLDSAVPLTLDEGIPVHVLIDVSNFGPGYARRVDDYTVSGPSTSIAVIDEIDRIITVVQPGQATASFTITAVNDDDYEVEEELSLLVTNAVLYIIETTRRVNINISSEDAPMVSISVVDGSSEVTIAENGGRTFIIVAFAPAIPMDTILHGLRLRFEAFGGAARFLNTTPGARVDITTNPSTALTSSTADGATATILSLTPDTSSASISSFDLLVRAVDNSEYNYYDRSYRVSIESPPAGYLVDPAASSITINIGDDDVPTVTFSTNNLIIREDGTSSPGCDDMMSNCTIIELTLGYALRDDLDILIGITELDADDANNLGDDYTVMVGDTPVTQSPFAVTVPAGELSASFTVAAVNDDEVEPVDGSARFRLAPSTGAFPSYVAGDPTSVDVTIKSEDIGEASITVAAADEVSASSVAIPEAGEDADARRATLTISIDAPMNTTLDVPLMFSAIGGADVPVTSVAGVGVVADSWSPATFAVSGDTLTIRNVEFSEGEGVNDGMSKATIVLNIVDDTKIEPDEGYTFTLLPVDDAYTVAATPSDSVTVNITNDDQAIVSIYDQSDRASRTIDSHEAAIHVVAVEIDNEVAPLGGLAVGLMPTAGAFSLASNTGTIAGNTFTIPGGQSSATFTVTILSGMADSDSITIVDGEGYELSETRATISYNITSSTDEIPPGLVTDLEVIPGSGLVTLSWTNPADVRLVRITTTTGATPFSTLTVLTMPGAAATQVITGLVNGTIYTFSVIAIDASGNESAPVSITRELPEKIMRMYQSTPAVTLEGSVHIVTVEFRVVAPPGGATVNIRASDATMAEHYTLSGDTGTITGSHPDYMFTIPEGMMEATYIVTMADDIVAAGENANVRLDLQADPDPDPDYEVHEFVNSVAYTIVDSTGAVVPDKVTDLTAVDGNEEVTLSWTNPQDVSLVRITTTAGATPVSTLTVVPGLEPVSSQTITGLSNGTTYTFSVVAVDTSGNESDPVTIPGMPQSLRVASLQAPERTDIGIFETSVHILTVTLDRAAPAGGTTVNVTDTTSAAHRPTLSEADDYGILSDGNIINTTRIEYEFTIPEGRTSATFAVTMAVLTPGGMTFNARLVLDGGTGYEVHATANEIVYIVRARTDSTSQLSVTNLTAAEDAGAVVLSWTNSGASLLRIKIFRGVGDGKTSLRTMTLNATDGANTLRVTRDITNGMYTFEAVTVDSSGNESVPATATVTVAGSTTLLVAQIYSHRDGEDNPVTTVNTFEAAVHTATVKLNRAAPAGGTTVNIVTGSGVTLSDNTGTITGSNPNYMFTIPQGLTEATFTINIGHFRAIPGGVVSVERGLILQDGTGYEVDASFGSVTYTIFDQVDTTPPGPVTGLAATIPASRTVELSWTSPADSAVVKISITRRGESGSFRTLVHRATPGANSIRVGNLVNGIEHTFSVVAIDASGNESAPVTVMATPQHFRVASLSPRGAGHHTRETVVHIHTITLDRAAPVGGTTVNIAVIARGETHAEQASRYTLSQTDDYGILDGGHPNYSFTIAEGRTAATFAITIGADITDSVTVGQPLSVILKGGPGYVRIGDDAANTTFYEIFSKIDATIPALTVSNLTAVEDAGAVVLSWTHSGASPLRIRIFRVVGESRVLFRTLTLNATAGANTLRVTKDITNGMYSFEVVTVHANNGNLSDTLVPNPDCPMIDDPGNPGSMILDPSCPMRMIPLMIPNTPPATATVTVTGSTIPVAQIYHHRNGGNPVTFLHVLENAVHSATVRLDQEAPAGGTTVSIVASSDKLPNIVSELYTLSSSTGTITGSHPNYRFTIPQGLTEATFTVTIKEDISAIGQQVFSGDMNLALQVVTGYLVDPSASGIHYEIHNRSDTTSPVLVTMLEAVAAAGRVVLLSWSSPTDGVSVEISITRGVEPSPFRTLVYRALSGANSVRVGDLVNGTTYTFSVVAIDASGNRSAAETATATAIDLIGVQMYSHRGSSNEPVTAVSTFEGAVRSAIVRFSDPASAGGITVNIRADAATMAEHYTLSSNTGTITGSHPNYMFTMAEGMTEASFIITMADDIVAGDSTVNVVLELQLGTGYVTTSPASITYTIADKTGEAPGPVTMLEAVTASTSSVEVSWISPTDGVSARISITREGESEPFRTLVHSATPKKENSVSIGDLVNGTTYTFSVEAIDASGNASVAVEDMATPGPEISIYHQHDRANVSTNVFQGATHVVVVEMDDGVAPPGGFTVGLMPDASAFTLASNAGTIAGNTFTIPAGQSSATFTVTIVSRIGSGGDITIVDGEGYKPGETRATISYNVVSLLDPTPPGPVTALSASAGDGQVTLSWTNPADASVVRITTTTPPSTQVVSAVGTTQMQVITGLMNGTEYTFNVVAIDVYGNASTPAEIMATPVPEVSIYHQHDRASTTIASFEAVDHVAVVEMDSGVAPPDGLAVTLTPPAGVFSFASNTGTIAGNTFTIPGGQSSATFTVTILSATAENITIVDGEGYEPGTRATISYSVGDSSDTTDPGPVTALSASAGDGQVTLFWTNPQEESQDAVRVRITTTTGTTSSILDVGIGMNDIGMPAERIITGLINDTAYTFNVAAIDASGNASTAVEIMATPMPVTSPVVSIYHQHDRALRTIDSFEAAIHVVVVEVDNGVAPPGGLTVGLMPTAGAFSLASNTGTIAGNTFTIPADQSSATFTVTIVSGSAGGDITIVDGEGYEPGGGTRATISYNVEDSSDTTDPDPVTSLSASAGAGQVTLSWTNPDDASVVRITTTTTPPSTLVVSAVGTAQEQVITGLMDGTAYTFSVVAIDASGNESTSAEIMATPGLVVSIYHQHDRENVSTDVFEMAIHVVVVEVDSGVAPAGGLTVTVGLMPDASAFSLASNTGTIAGNTFTIPAGQSSATFTVTILSDTADSITIVDGEGYEPGETRATISYNVESLSDDTTAPDPVTALGAIASGDGQVTLSWTNPVVANVVDASVVRITTTAEMTPPSTLVVSAVGASQAQVITGLMNGTVHTFSVVAIDASGNESDAATITSLASDLPVVSIAITTDGVNYGNTASISELAGIAEVSITLTGPLTAGTSLLLDVTLIGSAANSFGATGSDLIVGATSGNGGYDSATNTYTHTPSSGLSGSFAALELGGIADSHHDPGEGYTFTLREVAGSYAVHHQNNSFTVNIATSDGEAITIYGIDADGNETGTLSVEAGNSLDITIATADPAPEGGVTGTIRYAYDATLSHPNDPFVDGDLALSSSTGAISGSSPNYMFTIPQGETSVTFTVNTRAGIIRNLVSNVTYTLTLDPPPDPRPEGYPPNGYGVGAPGAITLSVMGEHDPLANMYIPVLAFGEIVRHNNINGFERQTAEVTVELDVASETDTTIDIMVTNDPVVEGGFWLLNGTGILNISNTEFTVPAGNTTATFRIRIAENAIAPGETGTVVVSMVAGDGYRLGPGQTMTVSIRNNTDPVTDLEAVPGNGRVSLSWTNPPDPRPNITITTAIISATTTGGRPVDLNGDTAGTELVLSASAGTMGSYIIEGLDNGTAYTFSVVSVNSSRSVDNRSTPVTVVTTPGTVEPVSTVAATAASGLVILTWTNPDSIDLSSVRISATDVRGNPVDLNGDADGNSLTVPAMPGTEGSQIIEVGSQAIEGGLVAGTEYSFTIVAVDSGGNVSEASAATATASATPYVSDAVLGATDTSLDEGETASFTVILSSSVPAGTPPVDVLLTATGSGSGSDIDIGRPGGANYERTVTIGGTTYHVIRIAAPNDTGTFTIQALADHTYEKVPEGQDDEAFTVTIAAPPDGSTGYRYAPSTTTEPATVTIVDGDTIPVVHLSPDSTVMDENNPGFINRVMLLLSPKNQYAATTVTVTTTAYDPDPEKGQTHLAAIDGDPRFLDVTGVVPSQTVTVPANTDTALVYNMKAVDDNLYDGSEREQFTLTVESDTADPETYTTGDPVIIRIVDNEPRPVASVVFLDHNGNPTSDVFEDIEKNRWQLSVTPPAPGGSGLGNAQAIRLSFSVPPDVNVSVRFTNSSTDTVSCYTSHSFTAMSGCHIGVPVHAGTTSTIFMVQIGDADGGTLDYTMNVPDPSAEIHLYTVAAAPMNRFRIEVLPLPVITMRVVPATIHEAGETAATITVTRSRRRYTTNMEVILRLSGSATHSSDFRTSGGIMSNRVSIPVGMESATFTVTAIDDTVIDANEDITYTVVSSEAYIVPTPAPEVTITITDND